MTSLTLVIPDPGRTVSGGHLYNQNLMGGLAAVGCRVEAIDFAEFAQRLGRGVDGPYLIDTLYLSDLDAVPLESCAAWLLVHHLDSMHPPAGRTAAELYAVEAPVLRRLRGLVATGEFARDYLIGRGHDPGRIALVLPAAERLQRRRTPRGADHSLRVLVVANLIERKGVLAFLHGLAAVLRPGDDLAVRIVGGDEIEPAYAAECHALVAAELASQVVLVGSVPHATVIEELANADVFVSAAGMETFGIALQEAVAAGLPILAVDAGNVRSHLRPGVNGLLLPDPAAIATRLRGWLDDRSEFDALALSAPEVAPQGPGSWADAARLLLARLLP